MNDVYETAKAGGRYGDFYSQYRGKYLPSLERASRSFGKLVAEHEAWIADPALKLSGDMPANEVAFYVQGKWPRDVKRNRAYRDIIDGLIEERRSGGSD